MFYCILNTPLKKPSVICTMQSDSSAENTGFWRDDLNQILVENSVILNTKHARLREKSNMDVRSFTMIRIDVLISFYRSFFWNLFSKSFQKICRWFYRSNHRSCSVKKVFLKIWDILQENVCVVHIYLRPIDRTWRKERLKRNFVAAKSVRYNNFFERKNIF